MDAMQVLQEQAAERERALKAFARREALEEAARVCEDRWLEEQDRSIYAALGRCADAIRALIAPEPS
jgi:hypothetical protein